MGRVNPPEAILRNLERAPDRMRMVDEVLDPDVARNFAEGISQILEHANPIGKTLASKIAPGDLRTHACIKLLAAAAELETAWDDLRLPNMSASHRSTRVACEFVGLAVLYSMPRAALIDLPLGNDRRLKNCLLKNPTMRLDEMYEVRRAEDAPLLPGPTILPAFHAVADLVQAPTDSVESLRRHLKEVQHPASHASTQGWLDQIRGAPSGMAGLRFDPSEAQLYRDTASELMNLTLVLATILDRVTDYLPSPQ